MRACPWNVPCVCGEHLTADERLWIHEDFGYVYGYVVGESTTGLLRIQLTRPLGINPSHNSAGARIDLSTELMTEVTRRE